VELIILDRVRLPQFPLPTLPTYFSSDLNTFLKLPACLTQDGLRYPERGWSSSEKLLSARITIRAFTDSHWCNFGRIGPLVMLLDYRRVGLVCIRDREATSYCAGNGDARDNMLPRGAGTSAIGWVLVVPGFGRRGLPPLQCWTKSLRLPWPFVSPTSILPNIDTYKI